MKRSSATSHTTSVVGEDQENPSEFQVGGAVTAQHLVAYLFELRKVARLQKQLEDTSLLSEQFDELKQKLKNVMGDLKVSEDNYDEVEKSMRDLKDDNDRLGRQGNEAQNLLSDEKKKLTEAYSCTVLWTQACQKQESKTQEVEAEASNLRQQNQALQDSVKDLSESVKKIETELAQEKIQTQAVQETQKYWSERHLETDSERQMAIDQRDEEVEKCKIMKADLDTSRIVSKQHAEGEEAWSLIYHSERAGWEKKAKQLEKSLTESNKQLSECQRLLSRAQDAAKVKSDINNRVAKQNTETASRLSEKQAELETIAETLRVRQRELSFPSTGCALCVGQAGVGAATQPNYLDGALSEPALK